MPLPLIQFVQRRAASGVESVNQARFACQQQVGCREVSVVDGCVQHTVSLQIYCIDQPRPEVKQHLHNFDSPLRHCHPQCSMMVLVHFAHKFWLACKQCLCEVFKADKGGKVEGSSSIIDLVNQIGFVRK